MPKAKHKVVLFLPKPRRHTFSTSLPIPLLKLASMLDRKRFEPKIVTSRPDVDFVEQVAAESANALCVCLSVMTGHDILAAIEAVKEIRKTNPGVPIVWGGWHASILPQQTLESEYVDIIVRAQGERTFKELVERLAAGQSLKGLLGTSYKDKSGKIIHNNDRPFEDINNFPPLPYGLVNVEDHVEYVDGKRSMFYITSQGCPFTCKFCAEPLVFRQRWSALSNDRILKDWQFLVEKHNIEYMMVGDDNFFINEKKVQDFCKKLIRKNLPLKWGRAQGRARQMLAFSDETWRLIRESGCTDVQFGAETGSQEILDFINKNLTVGESVQFIERARRFKIKVLPALILGLPTEKFSNASQEQINGFLDEQVHSMFDLLDRCYASKKDYDEIRLYCYIPYPGNPLYDLACKLGFPQPKKLEEWSRIKTAPWIPKKILGLRKQLNDFYFPYARDGYLERHIKRFRFLQKIFHRTSLWRWRHRFFRFPVEYAMYRLYTGTRTMLTGSTATEHE